MEHYSRAFLSVEFLEPLLAAKLAFDSSCSFFKEKKKNTPQTTKPPLIPTKHSLVWSTEQFWCTLSFSFGDKIKLEAQLQPHIKYVPTPKDEVKVAVNDLSFTQL